MRIASGVVDAVNRSQPEITTMLRITFAALLAAGLLSAALACSSEEPSPPATDLPAPTVSGVAQTQGQDSAVPATDVPSQAPSTAAPVAVTAGAPTTQAADPTAQAQAPAAPTDAATTSPPATAARTAAATALPSPTSDSPSPTNTLPPPTEAPAAVPTPTLLRPAAPEGTNVGETPPAFAMNLVDGAQVASADLAMTGRPVFMHYFATW